MRIQPHNAWIFERRERPQARVAVPGEDKDRALVSRHCLRQLRIDAGNAARPLHHHAGLGNRIEDD
jgi:hypothetical protein